MLIKWDGVCVVLGVGVYWKLAEKTGLVSWPDAFLPKGFEIINIWSDETAFLLFSENYFLIKKIVDWIKIVGLEKKKHCQ